MKLRFKARNWGDNVHVGNGEVIVPTETEKDGGPADVLFDVEDEAIANALLNHPRVVKTAGAPKRKNA